MSCVPFREDSATGVNTCPRVNLHSAIHDNLEIQYSKVHICNLMENVDAAICVLFIAYALLILCCFPVACSICNRDAEVAAILRY